MNVSFKTSRPPTVDENDVKTKAKALHLLNFSRPHGRTFHIAWLSFLTAFTGWFSIPPLMTTIVKDLKLTKVEAKQSNIYPLITSVIFRTFAGFFCDLIGPRRVMAALLLLGAIPTALTGLIHNASGLYASRFFIGILGATFVPCQFYTTQMYEKNVVGSANAFAGGWGNLGGGLTYILMPLVFNAIDSVINNPGISWRVALVIPSGLCIIVALLNIFFADDCPEGDWLKRKETVVEVHIAGEKSGSGNISEVHNANGKISDGKISNEKNSNDDTNNTRVYSEPEKTSSKIHEFKRAFYNPYVIIMMMQYACTFGVELAVDGVIGGFFEETFGLNQTIGGFIGSIFGLMNLFSRATGGVLSDYTNSKLGMCGRLWSQFFFLFAQGVFLIIFRFSLQSLTSAIIIMIIFSYFTQGGCGTTYGIAPYIDPPIYGTVAGLIGAGGNIGGIAFASVFAHYADSTETGFLVIGCVVIVISLSTFFLKVSEERMIKIKK